MRFEGDFDRSTMFNAHTNFYDERGGFMLSRRTKFKAGIGVSVGCAGLAIGLLGAPSAMAGGGCANGGAEIGSLSKGQARAAIVCEINAVRGPALSRNAQLESAAQKHSKVMRNKDCFKHKCPGEGDLGDRIKAAGYISDGDAFKAGEAIAYGNTGSQPGTSSTRGSMTLPTDRCSKRAHTAMWVLASISATELPSSRQIWAFGSPSGSPQLKARRITPHATVVG